MLFPFLFLILFGQVGIIHALQKLKVILLLNVQIEI